MGVVYGAGSLWNWILYPGEPGHKDWTVAKGAGWREALDFEGSRYVGNLGKILGHFDISGVEPTNRIAPARRALWKPGKLLIIYIMNGNKGWFPETHDLPAHFRVYNPKTTEIVFEGSYPGEDWDKLALNKSQPYVLVMFNPDALKCHDE